jgi:hypothetical protein
VGIVVTISPKLGENLGAEAGDVLEGAAVVAGAFDQENEMADASAPRRRGQRAAAVLGGADGVQAAQQLGVLISVEWVGWRTIGAAAAARARPRWAGESRDRRIH